MAWIPSRQTGATRAHSGREESAQLREHAPSEVDVVAGATFVGSQTSTLDTTTIGNTAIVGDPPGLDHVTFDLTITQQFGKRINPAASDAFSGFVSIGVTIFGKNQAGQARDAQIDYSIGKEFSAGSLTPGTYHDRRIDLDALINPDTFTDESFNDLFGTQGSSPTDLIPTGFQFYFNKSGASSDYDHSLTLYIDNVRFGTGPSGVPGDYNGNGVRRYGRLRAVAQWRPVTERNCRRWHRQRSRLHRLARRFRKPCRQWQRTRHCQCSGAYWLDVAARKAEFRIWNSQGSFYALMQFIMPWL